MNDNNTDNNIIDYKLINIYVEKSYAALEDSKFLIEQKKYHIAINRIYYSIFYMISAFAVKDKFETSKHAQLIGYFNKNYISTKKIDANSKIITRLFELRNKADYDVYATFTKEQVDELCSISEKFLNDTKKYITDNLSKN